MQTSDEYSLVLGLHLLNKTFDADERRLNDVIIKSIGSKDANPNPQLLIVTFVLRARLFFKEKRLAAADEEIKS